MSIEITARHIEIEDELKNHVQTRCEGLTSEFPRIEHIHVILDAQKFHQLAEVVVQAKNHIRIEAAEDDENLRTAIDAALDKAERQLRRQRDKAQDHKHRRVSEVEEIISGQ
jgi:putative sigma-54 modulation protein